MIRSSSQLFPATVLVAFFVSALLGCSRGPGRVEAPVYDAEAMATKAFETGDTNSDGFLAGDELLAMPGVKASDNIDADKDGKISPDELQQVIQGYNNSKVGIMPLYLTFYRKGRSLVGAKVRLVPEAFMSDVVETAEGVTDEYGSAMITIPDHDPAGVRLGFYRMEVTSDTDTIAAKYNTATTLGFEATTMTTSGYAVTEYEIK